LKTTNKNWKHCKSFIAAPIERACDIGRSRNIAKALERPPVAASTELLWRAFEAVEPAVVKGHGGKLVDVIALVVMLSIRPKSQAISPPRWKSGIKHGLRPASGRA